MTINLAGAHKWVALDFVGTCDRVARQAVPSKVDLADGLEETPEDDCGVSQDAQLLQFVQSGVPSLIGAALPSNPKSQPVERPEVLLVFRWRKMVGRVDENFVTRV